jgi:hypothetical protein
LPLLAIPWNKYVAHRPAARSSDTLADITLRALKSPFGTVTSVDDLVDLISQESYSDRRRPLYISPHTDYDQLSAALKIFALVLSDLHRIYLAERLRIDLVQEGMDEDERMLRTEIDLIPILKPLEDAIEAADRKIRECTSSWERTHAER